MSPPPETPAEPGQDRLFEALAAGRVIWGVAAYAAPRANARALGAGDRATPETVYLTRIFGGRAVALGLGYLMGSPGSRRVSQGLGLVVDTADTVAGLVHLIRGDVPRRAAAILTVATGGYALMGVVGLARSRRHASRLDDHRPGIGTGKVTVPARDGRDAAQHGSHYPAPSPATSANG